MIINGKDIMLFFDLGGAELETVAYATNHALDLQSETQGTSNKDSGLWDDSEVTKLSWNATSEHFVGGIGVEDPYGKLVAAWMAAEPIDVYLAIPSNITNGEMPVGGWTAPTAGGYKGKAIITGVALNAADGQNATMSISLKGKGKLTPAVATT